MKNSILSRTLLITTILAIIGLIFMLFNIYQPIVRNSCLYARIVIEIKNNFGDGISIGTVSGKLGRPPCFALLAIPFTLFSGLNTGIILCSSFSTLLFMVFSFIFVRRMSTQYNLTEKDASLVLIFTFFNPLMIYQFWSAYPDTLSAAFYLASFLVLEQVFSKENNKNPILIILYFALLFVSVTIKYHTIVFGFVHLPLLLTYKRNVSKLIRKKEIIIALSLSIIGFGIMLTLAFYGNNPLLDLRSGTRTKSTPFAIIEKVLRGEAPILLIAAMNFIGFLIYLLVVFGPSTIFAFHKSNFSKKNIGMFISLGIFIFSLFLFPGSFMNPRYYIAIIPFIALLIVCGLNKVNKKTKYMFIAVTIFVNGFLILNYNNRQVFKSFGFINSRNLRACEYLISGPVPDTDSTGMNVSFSQEERMRSNIAELLEYIKLALRLSPSAVLLDNLRMPQHIAVNEAFDNINDNIAYGGKVYLILPPYYDKTVNGLYEMMGFIRSDISVEYPVNYGELPINEDCYVLCALLKDRVSYLEKRKAIFLQKGLYLIKASN